jgi:hypothetical protein
MMEADIRAYVDEIKAILEIIDALPDGAPALHIAEFPDWAQHPIYFFRPYSDNYTVYWMKLDCEGKSSVAFWDGTILHRYTWDETTFQASTFGCAFHFVYRVVGNKTDKGVCLSVGPSIQCNPTYKFDRTWLDLWCKTHLRDRKFVGAFDATIP